MIQYDKQGKNYILKEEISIKTDIHPDKAIKNKYSSITKAGKITLYPGFLWDGATGAVDTPKIMQASAMHDFICNEYNCGKLTKEQRELGDKMFKSQLKAANMWSFRVKYVYQAVRKFFEVKEWFKKVS